MIKHTKTIRGQQLNNCLRVFDHFVGMALEGLSILQKGLFEDTSQGPEYASGEGTNNHCDDYVQQINLFFLVNNYMHYFNFLIIN